MQHELKQQKNNAIKHPTGNGQGITITTMPANVPARIAATVPARMTTSHCARFTTGDWTCVNGAANAGTPAVNDGISMANRFRRRLSVDPTELELVTPDG